MLTILMKLYARHSVYKVRTDSYIAIVHTVLELLHLQQSVQLISSTATFIIALI